MNPRRIARKVKHFVLVNKDICLLELSEDAASLNEAISTTNRPYIAFTDVKNSDKDRYFNRLLAEMKKHPDVDMAGGILVSKRALSFQEGLPEETAILDSEKDFSLGIRYPEGIMCKTDVIRAAGIGFDDAFTYYRDEVFAMELSSAIEKRLYVPSLVYKPKREFDELFMNNPRTHQPGWYWELVHEVPEKLHADLGKVLKRSVQHGLLYHMLLCFDTNENAHVKMVFEDVPETLKYLDDAGTALRSVGLAVLFGRRRGTKWTNPKLLYLAKLRNKNKDPKLEMKLTDDGTDAMLYCTYGSKQRAFVQRFSPTNVYVQNLNLEAAEDGASVFKMHLRFPTCFPSDSFKLFLSCAYGGEAHDYECVETKVLSSCRTYFDQKAYDTVLWDVDVPLSRTVEDQKISAYAMYGDLRIPLKLAMLNKSTNRLRDDYEEAFWSIPSYMVKCLEGKIVLIPATEEDKLAAEELYCQALERGNEYEVECARLRRLYFETKPQFEGKRIWAYFDKAFKAGDNAEFLIRYAAQQDDGIDHVFYIDPESADYQRIKRDGLHVLNPKSDEGLMHLLNAEVLFATHVPAYRIPGIKDRDMPCFKDLVGAKNIRLYHGFTLTHDCSYSQPFMDSCGVAVSSRYEHELYADPVHGFKEEEIIDSGMPRHDGVLPNNQRWILFAPTWRPALRGGVGFGGRTLYNEHFRESRYYQRYHSIFTDERLLECARRNGYKIKLYLHPRMAPMTVDFEPDQNDVFEAIDCTQGTEYADIMSKSDLMITDYSSVMIDFAYSRKPVVYYQDPALPYWRYFDFDYKNIGFGEVAASTEEVIKLVCEYMDNNCALKDFYRKRIDDFFFYDDRNGAKRLYEAVRNMVG
ncbi:MAG: CDP-glycerol glycerophosphotransferase family protein [Eggerthellaceae bacterium]|nr:CDP-glycerol glycerophosphotransferase family protein [Eggerthellaceae bacterium]